MDVMVKRETNYITRRLGSDATYIWFSGIDIGALMHKETGRLKPRRPAMSTPQTRFFSTKGVLIGHSTLGLLFLQPCTTKTQPPTGTCNPCSTGG